MAQKTNPFSPQLQYRLGQARSGKKIKKLFMLRALNLCARKPSQSYSTLCKGFWEKRIVYFCSVALAISHPRNPWFQTLLAKSKPVGRVN
jgi:hypothetical protein